MCAYQPKYHSGDWVALIHPQITSPKDSPQWTIPLKDFKMWDHAFLTRYGVPKAEAQEKLLPFPKEEVFIVLRNTTRKQGKRRLKVLNPYTGKSKAVFVEQVKCKLDMKLEPTSVSRWVLLDKWRHHTAPTNSVGMEEPIEVMGLDAENAYFNDLDPSALAFKPASYFGAATIMCPKEINSPLRDAKNWKAEEDEKTEELLHSLLKSLGMDNKEGVCCYPDEMTLVIGAPHMNTNLTKYYTTRPSLGCILKVGNGRFVYDKDSLYNKQAPESYKTKSAEGDECEYFYIPFYQVKHTFSLEIPTDSENVVFGNYPEYGAAHLLAAL
jgi:hypothetical protein